MKKYLTLLFILTYVAFVQGQSSSSLADLADSLYRIGEYQSAADNYEAYFSDAEENLDVGHYYNAAVAFAQVNNAGKSIRWLQKAVDGGVDDDYLTEVRFDLNFYPIRHTEEWKSFFDKNTKVFNTEAASIMYPHIRHELMELWQADQYYRRLIFGRYNGRPPNEVGNVTEAVDRYNAMRVEQIIEEIGWPTYDKVGRDGAHAAWNIIQHAVFNPPLMKQSLEMMEEALASGQVDGVDYAYLYDRFQAVSNLGKQRYGIVRHVPIEDEHELERRRKEIGFRQSMVEYLGAYTPLTESEYKAKESDLANSYTSNLEKGKVALDNQNYEEAAKYYKKVLSCNGHIQTEDIYNAARLQALLNTPRSNFQAIRYIRCLSARGYNNLKRMDEDSAFDNLRDNKGYMEIVGIIKKYNSEQ